MKKPININTNDWCDLVFENKNKQYGAYELRQEANKGYMIAFFSTLLFVAALSVSPLLFDFSQPQVKNTTSTKDIEYRLVEVNNIVKPKMELPPEMPKPETPQKIKKTIVYTIPDIVPDDEVEAGKELKDMETVLNSGAAIGTVDVPNGSTDGDAVPPEKFVEYVEAEPTSNIINIAEQEPEFPGGAKALYDFLSKNVQYPSMDKENGIQGRVVVRFAVMSDGKIDKIEVVKGVSPACDREALRVVKRMPDWIPGKQNGRDISVYYAIPIRFKLI